MAQNLKHSVEEEAAVYVSEEKGVANIKEAVEGASDILAENIADTAAYRMWIRQQFEKEGCLVSEAKDDQTKSVYEMYYHFRNLCQKLRDTEFWLSTEQKKKRLSTLLLKHQRHL